MHHTTNDDESLQRQLLSSSSSSASISYDPSAEISPMNSHFTALTCSDTMRLILSKLSVMDLARASCVCRLWNSIVADNNMIVFAFKAPWKLKEVVGKPTNGSFWRDNGIGKFAISHRIARGDTVASLAVKYSVQVTGIKRLNNMMSDHGIYSRDKLLIPISNPEILIDGTCYILKDHLSKSLCVLNRVTSDRDERRIMDSLRRGMQVDDGTAQYYLSISNGDPRASLSEFSADIVWERQSGLAS